MGINKNRNEIGKILIRILLAYFIVGCGGQEHVARLNAEGARVFTCEDFNFEWDGRHLSQGSPIGKGVNGIVFNLNSNGKVDDDLVMKFIKKSDYDLAKKSAFEELRLSQELAGIATNAKFRGVFMLEEQEGEKSYAAILMKEKVNGHTLYDLISGGLIHKDNIEQYKKSFDEFREVLLQRMLQLNERQMYLWDIHAKNIMYDSLKNKWVIVDGELSNSYFTFNKTMQDFAKYYKLGQHQVVEIAQLLNERGSKRDAQFFKDYLDIYTGGADDYFQSLTGQESK